MVMNEDNALQKLYKTILMRKSEKMEGSYTNYLFDKGLDKILKKVGEETTEVIIASKNENKEELVSEISDLVYHLMVLMVNKNLSPDDILSEIDRRSLKIGNKKAERKKVEKI
jgi:phosphoribosyl-ATP pyrophosphohydrolase